MVKKIIATIMSCSMILSAAPNTVVFAAENKTSQEKTITDYQNQTDLMDNSTNQENTYESIGQEYQVSSVSDLENAINQIKSSKEEKATIVLTKSIDRSFKFAGVEEKQTMLKSKGSSNYSIELASEIVGDLTLDNICIDNGKNYSIYANGHRFETTVNFYSTKSKKDFPILYGGGSQGNDVTEGGTNLILRGNVNFGRVYGGGHDSNVTGDTNILIDDKRTSGSVHGGGYAEKTQEGKVFGDTNLILKKGYLSFLAGGGFNNTQKVDYGKEPARVHGDTNITVGEEGATTLQAVYGAAHTSLGGSFCSTVKNVHWNILGGSCNYSPKNFENGDANYNAGIGSLNGCGYRDIVEGTVSIYVGTGAYVSGIYAAGGMSKAFDGTGTGPSEVKVLNKENKKYAVHVVYENDEVYDNVNKNRYHSLTIGSYNEDGAVTSTVNGNVLVEMKSGYLDSIIIDGGDEDWQRGLSLNGDSEIIVKGGRVRDIIGDSRHWNDKDYIDSVIFNGCKQCEVGQMKVMGNIQMKNAAELLIDDSKFYEKSTRVPFVNCDNLSITEESNLITRDAETQLKENVEMQNGTWNAKGKLWVYEKMTSENSNMIFEKDYAIGFNHRNDATITDFTCFKSKNDIFVSLNPLEGTYGNFVGNVTLNESDMTFMCPTDVWGNWQGGNSVIKVPTVTQNYDGTENGADIALNIQKIASGNSTIKTVNPDKYQELKEPKLGDNYVVGLKADGDNPVESTFTLGNDSALEKGYYLKRIDDLANADDNYMWQVAKKETFNAIYKFESTDGKELPEEVTKLLPTTDNTEYKKGEKVTPKSLTTTEVKVNDGKWIFKGWTPSGEQTFSDKNIEFIGKWEFVKGGTGGGTVTPTPKPDPEDPDRIEGGDRIETSVESSKDLYPNGTNAVVLANCERYTDVLTADPFAIQEKASALLTYKYELPEKTLKEIQRLGAKKIYISGGYDAVSKKVVDELAAKGYEIFRFDGIDRYDTARKIAIKIREKGNTNAAELASGENYPDALCMTPLAVKDHAPILLTKKDSIPKYTKQALAEWDIENIKIGGLDKAVSKEVEKQLKSGFSIEKDNKKDSNVYDGAKVVKRIGGEDRYETSAKLAKESYPDSKLGVYATGEDFPDALIAGNYAGRKEAPVLLVKKDTLPEPIEKYTKESKIKKATIIGGVNAVSDKVLNLIKDAIRK